MGKRLGIRLSGIESLEARRLMSTSTASSDLAAPPEAVASGPVMLDPGLTVKTVVSGLVTPTAMAFLEPDDFLVLEKNTGRVRRVVDGLITGTALDLPVNSFGERGLLGIALSPRFRRDRAVYLDWTESSSGADSGGFGEVPTLSNRVDRFTWSGSTLAYDRTLIRLRSSQEEPGPSTHDGGVLEFGPDGKLYVVSVSNGAVYEVMPVSHARTPRGPRALLERLPKRPTDAITVGALGDSYTDEYRFYPPHRNTARNWVELLAATRPIDFGRFTTSGRGEPRNQGFAFNWARSDATSDEMVRHQLPGLARQVSAGKVQYAWIFVGGNDFFGVLRRPDPASALAAVAPAVPQNFLTAVQTLLAAVPDVRLVVATVPEFTRGPESAGAVHSGLIPRPTARPSTSPGRAGSSSLTEAVRVAARIVERRRAWPLTGRSPRVSRQGRGSSGPGRTGGRWGRRSGRSAGRRSPGCSGSPKAW